MTAHRPGIRATASGAGWRRQDLPRDYDWFRGHDETPHFWRSDEVNTRWRTDAEMEADPTFRVVAVPDGQGGFVTGLLPQMLTEDTPEPARPWAATFYDKGGHNRWMTFEAGQHDADWNSASRWQTVIDRADGRPVYVIAGSAS